jgi:hypothetical protein
VSWDELAWKLKGIVRRPNVVGPAVIALLAFYLVVPFAAPFLFGGRGELFSLAIRWLVIVGLGGMFAAFAWFVLRYARPERRWLRLGAWTALIFFGGVAVVAAWQTVLSATDLVLPYREREITVTRTYYEEYETTRGALPETGGLHLVTDSGEDYHVRDSGDGDSVRPGRYRVVLSHFKHIVIAEHRLD